MKTVNHENYNQDDYNFNEIENDLNSINDLYSESKTIEESYVEQYQKEHALDNIESENPENKLAQDDENYLDNEFSNALERENEDDDYLEDDLEEDDLDDIDENDIDDDLVEDYDENDREIDNFATDSLKTDELDQEYDIDQDLEERDPVNHPREF